MSVATTFWWSEPILQAVVVLGVGVLLVLLGATYFANLRHSADRLFWRRSALKTTAVRVVAGVVAVIGLYLVLAQSIAWINGIVQ